MTKRIVSNRFTNLLLQLSSTISLLLMLSSCAPSTRMLQPVANFDSNRYLGVWYEIARLPHRFEKNLVSVTADYSLREDGSIDVINKGYDSVRKKWKSADGRAYFKKEANTALLKVTFFWPFYGEYKVIKLDEVNYSYAVVTSSTFNYLWILARTKELDAQTMKLLVDYIERSGFDTKKLVYVDQSLSN